MDTLIALGPYLGNPLTVLGVVLVLAFGIHKALLSSGIITPLGAKASHSLAGVILRYGFWIAISVIVLGFLTPLLDKMVSAIGAPHSVQHDINQTNSNGDNIVNTRDQ